MNAHHQLERQLRTSVAHRAGRRPSVQRRRWLPSHGFSSLLLAVSSAVVFGVALFALVALHHRRPQTPQAAPTVTNPHRFSKPPTPGPIPPNADDAVIAASFNTAARQDRACGPGSGGVTATISQGTPSAAILSTVPILQRPATASDRLPTNYHYFHGRLIGPFQGGKVYIRYVRLARVVDGTSFYLIPAGNLGRRPLSQNAAARCYRLLVTALRAQLPKVPSTERTTTLRYATSEFASARWNLAHSSVYEGVSLIDQYPAGGGGGSGGLSAATIRHGGILGGGGGGKPPHPIMLDGIVPPDVATVTLEFPASGHGSRRLPALSATGDVVNDVFVIPVPTLFQRGGWPSTAIWRAASGKVIKTIDENPFHP